VKNNQPKFVASACIEAFPLAADLTAKRNTLVKILQAPVAADPADEEKRDRFAARANSILAFIECPDEVRPKLREAIVEAMLWAQTQG
jgi:hypothetical protein